MTGYVFVGPTLDHEEVCDSFDFVCLPPAAQGDVYRAAQNRPSAIGIIDGYFEGVPSVWHKEILWAMSQGIHVFGSASMGALRAAELHAFGMRGVGQIFEAYRDGTLEDDDEVAVLHGPVETGYVAVSEAMVNIRANLAKAVSEGVIATTTGEALEHCAKLLFYQDRTWDALTAEPMAPNIPAAELKTLRNWLPTARIDLKASDARAMLGEMRDLLATSPGPARVTYSFEWTDMWDTATACSRFIDDNPAETPEDLPRGRLLDELRLDLDAHRTARDQAIARLLAVRESRRQRLEVDRSAVSATANRFRARWGLFNRAAVDRWLAENQLDLEGFETLLQEEAQIEAVKSIFSPAVEKHLMNHLRVSNQYRDLAERALDKHAVLAAAGFADPQPADTGLTPPRLAAWYFEERLGRTIPDDLEGFAHSLALKNRDELYRHIAREFLYLRLKESPPDSRMGAG